MNKTLNNLKSLYQNCILSETEYNENVRHYTFLKVAAHEFEMATSRHVKAMMHEKSKEVSKSVKETMTKRKRIQEMYLDGIIDEETMNDMLKRMKR